MKFDSTRLKSEPKTYKNTPWIAVLGNPNCGKTAVFNRLTGLHHKVGNYPGITVEKKTGWLKGRRILVRDFPGTYSLIAKSIDEKIVADMVQSWRKPENRPFLVLVVVDATNLTRNIYLALQVLDWQIPTILVLNMIDEVRNKGISIDCALLAKRLNATAVVPTSAKYGDGIPHLLEIINNFKPSNTTKATEPRLLAIEQFSGFIEEIVHFLQRKSDRLNHHSTIDALRLISEPYYLTYLEEFLSQDEIKELNNLLHQARNRFIRQGIPFQTIEQASRYAFIDIYLADIIEQEKITEKTFSEKIDTVLTHKFLGPIILFILLVIIFNAIFNWAQWPMGQISAGISWFSEVIDTSFPDTILKSLIMDGILSGVGSVLVFLPQIIILVFFLSILEDSGYMARMAFMMDRLMHKIGLHGRSVLPLLSGFACAIPAVMSSRTIDNWRDRLQTILMIPLMSCSARLPIYTLLIAAFIPQTIFFGFLSLQGFALMGIYFLGMLSAIVISIIIKKIRKSPVEHPAIMELPPYRRPLLTSIWWQVYERGKVFLINAGTIILAISIILWFLATFPRYPAEQNLSNREKIERSYAGQLGHALEPIIKPLGYDWKIGIGLISSFAAREVIISTLSTLYNLEDTKTGSRNLIEAIREDRYPDGRPVFNTLVAISLMVFFAYAAQCMATFAVIKRETNSWKWPVLMVIYMTSLAYITSLIVYQVGLILGLG